MLEPLEDHDFSLVKKLLDQFWIKCLAVQKNFNYKEDEKSLALEDQFIMKLLLLKRDLLVAVGVNLDLPPEEELEHFIWGDGMGQNTLKRWQMKTAEWKALTNKRSKNEYFKKFY